MKAIAVAGFLVSSENGHTLLSLLRWWSPYSVGFGKGCGLVSCKILQSTLLEGLEDLFLGKQGSISRLVCLRDFQLCNQYFLL